MGNKSMLFGGGVAFGFGVGNPITRKWIAKGALRASPYAFRGTVGIAKIGGKTILPAWLIYNAGASIKTGYKAPGTPRARAETAVVNFVHRSTGIPESSVVPLNKKYNTPWVAQYAIEFVNSIPNWRIQ